MDNNNTSSPNTRHKTRMRTVIREMSKRPKYKPIQFHINDSFIDEFNARLVGGNDCVINALHVLKQIPPVASELLRILVGHRGVHIDKIACIFDSISRADNRWRTHRLAEYTKEDFISTVHKLKPSHVIFVGITRTNSIGHAFLIARSDANATSRYVILDPQVQPRSIGGTTRFRHQGRQSVNVQSIKPFLDRETNINAYYILEQQMSEHERKNAFMRVFNVDTNNEYEIRKFSKLMKEFQTELGYGNDTLGFYFTEKPKKLYEMYLNRMHDMDVT